MTVMEIVFLAFLAFACLMAMFSMLILLRDIVKDGRSNNNNTAQSPTQEQAQTPMAPIVQVVSPAPYAPVAPAPAAIPAPVAPAPVAEPVAPVVAPAPVVEVKEEPAPAVVEEVAPAVVEEVEEETIADDNVSFTSEKSLTIDDRYLELTSDQKTWYDEIIKYASAVDGSRRFKNARYEEYKVGKNRLVRMLIKRGLIVCEFILPNNDFKNYVNENKLKIKAAPTVLKVLDAETVQIAKDSIDIAVKAIEEEKEFKKQQIRERRKQARLAEKQGADE